MKKWMLMTALFTCAFCAYAQDGAEAGAPAQCNLPQEAAKLTPAQTKQETPFLAFSSEEQYKRFKARNKEIRKLAKAYRKAKTETKKAEIKARLSQIVSEATDEGLAWSKWRIAAERANLAQWEQKIAEQEKDLPGVKARRVDDILSGEAQRRHELAQKRWKKEMKDRKKYMK